MVSSAMISFRLEIRRYPLLRPGTALHRTGLPMFYSAADLCGSFRRNDINGLDDHFNDLLSGSPVSQIGSGNGSATEHIQRSALIDRRKIALDYVGFQHFGVFRRKSPGGCLPAESLSARSLSENQCRRKPCRVRYRGQCRSRLHKIHLHRHSFRLFSSGF